MKLSDFSYHLPDELIAQHPLAERTQSRLLHLDRQSGALQHQQFSDLPGLLRAGDVLVFNDTQVIPARLYGRKTTGGKLEILVERVLANSQLLAHIRASHAPKVDSEIFLSTAEIPATVTGREDDLFILQLPTDFDIYEFLDQQGHIPLPPYITRADENLDHERYQTVYAREKGAVAAPTAGLHFDQQILQQIATLGVEFAYVTLHVGAGTFQPVRVADISSHKMHKEYFTVPDETADIVNRAKQEKRRVIAVGTTSVRALESSAQDGKLVAGRGDTNIFIYPGFNWQITEGLITNFHLPESTLLMLVAAFAGYDAILNAYQQAVAEQYRFFSYGDAMVIL